MIDFIKKHLLNSVGKLNSKKMNRTWFVKNGFETQYDNIQASFDLDDSLSKKIKGLLYYKTCLKCGALTFSEKEGYCSLSCANQSELRGQHIKESWKQNGSSLKQRETFIRNNGVESNFHRKEVQDKIVNRNHIEEIIQSFQVKYGVSNPSQLNDHQEKTQKTMKEKFGVNHSSQIHLKYVFENLTSQEWWNQYSSFIEVKNELNSYLSLSQIYLYAHKYRPDWNFKSSISSPHQQVISFLIKQEIEYQVNTRQIIAPLELDIYIPKYNLAIEVNGAYWHSELNGKDKNYHLNKTLECEKQGIQLLQFWDFEIEQQWDIVSSMILSKLGIYEKRIGARQCLIKEVDSKMEQEFLEKNHIQGYRPSSLCYGLFYHDELVSLMSFGKPRYNKKVDWELLRFCNKINTQVIGGASRLFKKRPEGSLVSYADRRYSDGKIYIHLGFSFRKNNSPSYYYSNDFRVFYNRVKFQKHKLSTLLESFDPAITEWENMKANGYDRIWDCGSKTWIV